jgi:polar amino acid transport system permease protein
MPLLVPSNLSLGCQRLIITLIAMAIGLVLGLLLALIKLNKLPVLDQIRALAVSFIWHADLCSTLLTDTGIPLILSD